MDEAGWADVEQVRKLLGITQDELQEVVRRNDKRRLQLNGDDRIRACQGHTLDPDTMPVTREALEASWRRIEPAGPLWHGTRAEAIESIAEHGLHCGDRTHVHLAPAPDSKVGKRSKVEVLLEIDPVRLTGHGVGVFEAPNGVILVREVPPGCISGVRATESTKPGMLESARAALGLD
jgi:putative RNA 2'-phosphotransferase